MKLKSFFILGLAGICIYPLNTEAFQVKIDEDTFADIQAQIRVFYLNKGEDNNWKPAYFPKAQNFNYRHHYFQIYKFRFGAKGQINKFVSFYGNIDANENEDYEAKFWEGAFQFNFRPEFIIKTGKIRVPFSRHNFIGRHNSPVMSSDGDYFLATQFREALKAVDPYLGGLRETQPYKRTDLGVVVAGSIKEGLFKYYLSFFNEDKYLGTSNKPMNNRVWKLNGGWTNPQIIKDSEDKKGLEYDIRIEFTPTFWGFKAEPNVFDPSSREYQTYLGKFDTMTLGIGYHQEKHLDNLNKSIYKTSSLTRKAWAADFSFEKTFAKKYIIGAELGYMYFDDSHFYEIDNNKYKEGNVWTWYGEAHLIYKEKIGIGLPGIGFRYEYVETDGKYKNKADSIKDGLSYDRYGVCLSYWIKDVAQRIGIGLDYVKARDALKAYIKDENWEDSNLTWYIGIYANF